MRGRRGSRLAVCALVSVKHPGTASMHTVPRGTHARGADPTRGSTARPSAKQGELNEERVRTWPLAARLCPVHEPTAWGTESPPRPHSVPAQHPGPGPLPSCSPCWCPPREPPERAHLQEWPGQGSGPGGRLGWERESGRPLGGRRCYKRSPGGGTRETMPPTFL